MKMEAMNTKKNAILVFLLVILKISVLLFLYSYRSCRKKIGKKKVDQKA